MNDITNNTTPTTFKTNDIDLAAFLDSKGETPTITREARDSLASFLFSRTPELSTLIEEFVTGEAVVSVNGLLSSRRRLFKAVRALREVTP